MAADRASAREPGRKEGGRSLEGVEGAAARTARDLDRLIHQRTRLAIVSALAVGGEQSFNELKRAVRTTDGNLSVHARKLEEAGYLESAKSFRDRVPHTSYRLTDEGRRALERYLGHMESLIEAARPR
ncbi:MAG TPA: transcriptional regulator [Gemmatimonadota bacterium]|nr:transcriptional regulator [Gemmatimonadota bacterium]